MSKFILYGDSRSGNCFKVLWTANYLGAHCEWIETDIMAGQTRTPEFLAHNPFGQVPTAVFNVRGEQVVLTQSNAIVLYLAQTVRHPSFFPDNAELRAQIYGWLFWEQNSHEPYIAGRRFRKSLRGLADHEIDAEWLPRGIAALTHMNNALAEQAFLCGENLTAADIALVAYTRLASEGGFDLNPHANLTAWIARVERILDLEPIKA